MRKVNTAMKKKRFLINMILRRRVPALSCTQLKDTVSRKVMDTTRPNLIYHQKNFSSKNFSITKSTFPKKTQKALLKVLVLERNLLSRQHCLQVRAMMTITTDAEGLLHLLCHHRRNQLHLTTFIAVQLILILTVVVEVAMQVLLKHHASSLPLYQPIYIQGAFHWYDPDQDQRSEISQIIAHQRNPQIHPGKGFIGSFDLDPDHSKTILLNFMNPFKLLRYLYKLSLIKLDYRP